MFLIEKAFMDDFSVKDCERLIQDLVQVGDGAKESVEAAETSKAEVAINAEGSKSSLGPFGRAC
jgi:hypothetical protein